MVRDASIVILISWQCVLHVKLGICWMGIHVRDVELVVRNVHQLHHQHVRDASITGYSQLVPVLNAHRTA